MQLTVRIFFFSCFFSSPPSKKYLQHEKLFNFCTFRIEFPFGLPLSWDENWSNSKVLFVIMQKLIKKFLVFSFYCLAVWLFMAIVRSNTTTWCNYCLCCCIGCRCCRDLVQSCRNQLIFLRFFFQLFSRCLWLLL